MKHPAHARSALFSTATALILAGGLSACAGTANGTTSAGSGGSGSGGTTLVVGTDNGSPTMADNFNPFSANKRSGTAYMYEPLEYVNSINGQQTPFLATGHTLKGSTAVDFTIRTGVKWSDGQAFTSKDVLFSFDLLKKYPALDTTGVWSEIKSVTASGNSVTFIFKAPNVPFASTIAGIPIVPEHIWSKISDPTTYTNTSPVVTGPYVVGTFNPNQYTLLKNTKYWQAGNVAATRIVFPALTGNTQSQLELSQGGYDWATLFIPSVKTTWVAKDAQHNKYWFPPGGTISLFLNLTKKPYSDPAFRQALSYALDRTQIATKAEDGYVQPASQSGMLLPNLKSWLDPALPDSGLVTQNMTKATQMFAQAGYTKKGGTLVSAAGKAVTMTLQTPNGFTDWLQAAQVIQQQLKAVGITVNVQTPQYAAYNQALANGSFDASIASFGGTGSPYLDFFDAFDSAQSAPVGKPAASNYSRFSDPKLNGLLTKLQGETQIAQQHSTVNQLEQIMYKQVPVLALFYGATWGEYTTKNFTGWPDASNPYAPPAPYGAATAATGPPLMIITHLKAAA